MLLGKGGVKGMDEEWRSVARLFFVGILKPSFCIFI